MTAAPRTVVVGYDGSATARRALDLAAERAEGGTLYIVYAYDLPGPMKGGVAYDRVVGQHKQVGQDVLAGLPELPDVTVERELIGDHPAVAIAKSQRCAKPTRSSSAHVASARCAGRWAAPPTSCCTAPTAR